ncbi:MAG: diguanylate cyclase, partial [Deltaproteobacteria bacterium]|nr:diguanylate cyclase [Deltaproteobacteria bacterium]
KHSENRLNKAQDLARLANWNWEITTNIVTYSPTFYRLLEINPEDLPDNYDGLLATVHPEDRARVRSALAKAVFEEETFNLEYRMITTEGQAVIVHALADVVYDDFQEPSMVVGTIQDITARRKAEETVREQEALLRAIVETAGDGIITIDESGQVESFNRMAEKIFGYISEEVIGRNVGLLMLWPGSEIKNYHINKELSDGLAKGIGHDREVTGRRKDGSPVPLEISLSAVALKDRNLFTIMLRDVTEKKQAEEKLKLLATYDTLTGLFNRRHLMERLASELSAAKRYNHSLTVCLCDLDHFKLVNDTHGHQAGDTVLAALGRLLKANIRTEDIAGRYGGEEFVLILPRTSTQEATVVIERIRSTLEKTAFRTEKGLEFFVTGSFGLSETQGQNLDESGLLSQADQALYHAKESGRNRHAVYVPPAV